MINLFNQYILVLIILTLKYFNFIFNFNVYTIIDVQEKSGFVVYFKKWKYILAIKIEQKNITYVIHHLRKKIQTYR